MSWVIYKHTNKVNGKIYIGLTKQIPRKRWMNGLGYQTQEVFYNAILKYGWNNFKHEIIEQDIQTIEEANSLEQHYIKELHSYIRDPQCNGYNMTLGGDTNQTEKLWSEEEDNIIINYYPKEGFKVIERLNDRTLSSIYNRAFKLEVFFISNEWSIDEIERLKNLYPVEGISCWSKFPGRTKTAVHRKALLYNLKHSNKVFWTDVEKEIVANLYEKEGLSILKMLPNKTYSQLVTFVTKHQIRFDYGGWSEKEIKILKEHYPSMGLKVREFLNGRSDNAILKMASNLNIQAKTASKIIDIDTGIIYESQSDASRNTGIPVSLIKSVCQGKQKQAKGKHFAYYETRNKVEY